MAKFITFPVDITVKNPLSKEEAGGKTTFREFVVACLLTDKRFSTGWKAIKSAIAISDAVEACEPGKVMQLHDQDWEVLRDAAQTPSGDSYAGPLNAVGLMQLRPFFEAILNASDKAPSPVKKA